ncbi:hypothetical protein RclHR1_01050002 [Rhizophagus clarus]|uniref:SGNH/GDSL hydrolase family protein n=1 Tax=Rhizophagus clarus TaxID=94130 RepID=A0A2Z6QSX8_9GLOM|nr:hypothetical protein RclHR1_01050002 [Rhizophagus clarus]GES73890.1 SGNH/GDSL hydrolase family protein [Rhizophagus clarus]
MFSRTRLFFLIIYVGLFQYFSNEIIEAASLPCQFNTIVVFGDSTCDDGNGWRLTNYTYPPTEYYYQGRFSNGPVWVEYLSDYCRAKDDNYAYGGATADNKFVIALTGYNYDIPVPGIKQEVENIYLPEVKAKRIDFDKTLYIVGYQGNDYMNNPTVNPWEIVRILYEQWATLAKSGAKHILINSFFDLIHLPKAVRDSDLVKQLLAESVSSVHNAAIDFYVKKFKQEYKKVILYILPMNDIWNEIQRANIRKELGLTDFDNACVIRNTTYTICSNPEQHFFWDNIHPSTKVSRYVASRAYKIITRK